MQSVAHVFVLFYFIRWHYNVSSTAGGAGRVCREAGLDGGGGGSDAEGLSEFRKFQARYRGTEAAGEGPSRRRCRGGGAE
jgi:hypothetical protein